MSDDLIRQLRLRHQLPREALPDLCIDAADRIAALEKALRKYGRHTRWSEGHECRWWTGEDDECDCGLLNCTPDPKEGQE